MCDRPTELRAFAARGRRRLGAPQRRASPTPAVLGPVGPLHSVDLDRVGERRSRSTWSAWPTRWPCSVRSMVERGSGQPDHDVRRRRRRAQHGAPRISAYTCSKAAVVAPDGDRGRGAGRARRAGQRRRARAPSPPRFMEPVLAAGPTVGRRASCSSRPLAQRAEPDSLDGFDAVAAVPAWTRRHRSITGRVLSARWDDLLELRSARPPPALVAVPAAAHRRRAVRRARGGGLTVRVVVTGAAGFIGSNLCDALLADGPRGASASTTSRPAGASSWPRPTPTPGSSSPSSTSSTPRDLARRAGRRRRRRPPRRQRRRPLRLGGAAARPRAERDRDPQRAGGDAGRRRTGGSCSRRPARSTARRPSSRRPRTARSRVQTSLYGASKLAAEAYIQAYAEGAGLSTTVFRFVSNLGPRLHPRSRHRLRPPAAGRPDAADDPRRRDAAQELPRRHRLRRRHRRPARAGSPARGVQPRRRRLLHRRQLGSAGSASGSACSRRSSTRAVDRGWVGDNPFIYLDTAKIRPPGGSRGSASARRSSARSTSSSPTRGCSTTRRA